MNWYAGWVASTLMALWLIREWWHAKRHQSHQHTISTMSQTIQQMTHDNGQLRQWNEQLHASSLQQATTAWQQHKDVEERWQQITAQSLRMAQKDLLSQIEPVLTQWQHATTLRLHEHHAQLTHTVAPLDHTLQHVKQCIEDLEKSRQAAYGSLKEHLVHLHDGHQRLVKETNALTTAFRHPHVRGCWGEMQLRRVVELAGMLPYCDFEEQSTLVTDKKQGVRPDMVIRLPGMKKIVVDAKAPLAHYLEATSAPTTEEYRVKMKEHAQRVNRHIKALSDKNYWTYVPNACEFTVLFLPGESFLSAALEADTSLIESATQRNIVLATPMTLIALLKTIAQGWKHEALSQQTHTIMTLCQDILKHVHSVHKNMSTLGKNLKQAQHAYHATSDAWQEHIEPRLERMASLSPEKPSHEPPSSVPTTLIPSLDDSDIEEKAHVA